jgi:hypothetical protein
MKDLSVDGKLLSKFIFKKGHGLARSGSGQAQLAAVVSAVMNLRFT